MEKRNKQDKSLLDKSQLLVAKACKLMTESEQALSLQELAANFHLSPFYFHRLFKKITGITPQIYWQNIQKNRLKSSLQSADSVTNAMLEAGFNTSSRLYEKANQLLGMTPATYRQGGRGEQIYFAIGHCSLGAILVAATDKGICSIELADDPQQLLEQFQDRFPCAELHGGDQRFERWVAEVVGVIEHPEQPLTLPLDIRGTLFQQKVWQALRDIPLGKTVTYSEIAHQIDSPKAVRAVAQACAANKIAIAIPCHRVIRMDNSLAGYRWGIARKKTLLQREQQAANQSTHE